MALSDLAVYSEYAYTAMAEVLAQKVDLFNAASRGTLALSNGANQGDYSDKVFWQHTAGLVRRRDAYGSGAVASKKLVQLVDTMVKVAGGTPPIEMNPSEMKWIQQNPQAKGAAFGQQLAVQVMADMLNIGVASAYAALSNDAATIQYDGTGDVVDTLTPLMLNAGVGKFGDRQSSIVGYIVHSLAMNDYHASSLTNTQNLFKYETINVIEDAFGRVFIISDIPALYVAGNPKIMYTLGLTPGAVQIERNNDFEDNYSTTNGDENILRTYQAEWSYNLGIKGYAWDKAAGGHSPNDAALVAAANWNKIATSHKDLAGIIIKSN